MVSEPKKERKRLAWSGGSPKEIENLHPKKERTFKVVAVMANLRNQEGFLYGLSTNMLPIALRLANARKKHARKKARKKFVCSQARGKDPTGESTDSDPDPTLVVSAWVLWLTGATDSSHLLNTRKS